MAKGYFGMYLGVSHRAAIGFDGFGAAMCVGMMIGKIIGMMFPKGKQEKECRGMVAYEGNRG